MALGWVHPLLFVCFWFSHHVSPQPSHSGPSTLKTQNLGFPLLEFPICFHFKDFLVYHHHISFSPMISQAVHLCTHPHLYTAVNFHLLNLCIWIYSHILTVVPSWLLCLFRSASPWPSLQIKVFSALHFALDVGFSPVSPYASNYVWRSGLFLSQSKHIVIIIIIIWL